LLAVTSTLLGFPNWRAPVEFHQVTLATSGFGSLRTGWSDGIALFVPLLALVILDSKKWKFIVGLTVSVLLLAIIGSQLIVGGRAGLLTSMLIMVVLAYYKLSRVWFVAMMLTILLVGVSVAGVYINQLEEHLRIDRLFENKSTFEALDHFSADRLSGYLYAVNAFLERPITGYGFGNVIYDGREIHNVWLRLLVEAGILLPTVFLYIIANSIKSVKMLMQKNRSSSTSADTVISANSGQSLSLVLIGGVVISFLEPNVLVGSFQNTAIWWAVAGLGMAISDRKKIETKLRSHNKLVNSFAPRLKQC
jgi:O-antigen ligase